MSNNSLDGTKSKKRRRLRIVATIMVALVLIGVFLYPRIRRCVEYKKIIGLSEASKNLAGQPTTVEVNYTEDISSLDLGYAKTRIPDNWAKNITRKFDVIVIHSDSDESVAFMSPFFESTVTSDGDYSWSVGAAYARERSLYEVFFMSSSEYKELMKYTIPKALDTSNQNGIGLFETQDIRGIIRYGSQDEPGKMNVVLWSKRGEISQGIVVHAKSPDNAKRIIDCLLFQFQYVVDRVPPTKQLHEMIDNALTNK